MTKLKLKLLTERLLLILGGVIAGVSVIEIITISTGLLVPQDFADRHRWYYEFVEPNEHLAYKPKPNLRNFKLSWMEESVSEIVDTDKYGFRNPSRDYAATDLYFVGDSFTWGSWVSRKQTFYGIIESEIKQPVITLGVGGYGFDQYEVLFKDFIAKYKPKSVVLGIHPNDLVPLLSTIKDFHQEVAKEYESYSWYKKTLLYQIFFRKRVIKDSLKHELFRKQAKKASNGLTLYQYRGASKKYIKSNTNLKIEEVFLRIIDFSKANNVRLLVVLFPSKESAYITEYNRLFPEDIQYLENEKIGYQRLCQLAKAKDVVCIDLTSIFRQHGEDEKLYFDLDNHWNTNGHKLAAKEILKTLFQSHYK